MSALGRTIAGAGALALAVALAAAAGAGAADGAGAPALKAGDPPAVQEPVRISADEAEYFNAEGTVVFSGKVVAVQGDATLSADRMEVAFSRPEQPEKTAGGLAGAAAGRKITAITATGGVSFRQVDPDTKKERFATGEKGVYDDLRRTVTMTGNPKLWENQNVIVGEEMTFFIEGKKVIVKGKVNLTVYPEDLKEGGAPR